MQDLVKECRHRNSMSNTAISLEVKDAVEFSKLKSVGTFVKEFSGLSTLIELNTSSSIEQEELLSKLSEQSDDDADDGEEEEAKEEQSLSCCETGCGTGNVEGNNAEDEDGTSVIVDNDEKDPCIEV